MRGGYAHPAQRALQPQVEVGCVNADENVRRIGPPTTTQITTDGEDTGQVAQHFDDAHHRQRLEGVVTDKPCGLHAGTANALEPGVGVAPRQRLNQSRAQEIA